MTFKYTIMGEAWTIKILSRLPKGWDHSDSAITIPAQNLIVFNKKEFSLWNLIHELTHAYHKYLCLDSTTEMTLADREEIYCEMMAKYGIRIISDALVILLRAVKGNTFAINDEDRQLLKDLLTLEDSVESIMERLRDDHSS
jgi:hypothetical protein